MNVILVVPLSTPGYKPYAASTTIACPTCKEQCWIGPKQRMALNNKDIPNSVLKCLYCVARDIHSGKMEQPTGIRSLMTKEEEAVARRADGTN